MSSFQGVEVDWGSIEDLTPPWEVPVGTYEAYVDEANSGWETELPWDSGTRYLKLSFTIDDPAHPKLKGHRADRYTNWESPQQKSFLKQTIRAILGLGPTDPVTTELVGPNFENIMGRRVRIAVSKNLSKDGSKEYTNVKVLGPVKDGQYAETGARSAPTGGFRLGGVGAGGVSGKGLDD